MRDEPDTDRPTTPDDGPGIRSADPPPRDVLELTHVYTALSHPRRRYVCYALFEAEQWSLSELATTVAAMEAEVPRPAVTPGQHDRLCSSLYHTHLPKLRDIDVVRFDADSETVAHGPYADQVLAALQALATRLDPAPPGTRDDRDDVNA